MALRTAIGKLAFSLGYFGNLHTAAKILQSAASKITKYPKHQVKSPKSSSGKLRRLRLVSIQIIKIGSIRSISSNLRYHWAIDYTEASASVIELVKYR